MRRSARSSSIAVSTLVLHRADVTTCRSQAPSGWRHRSQVPASLRLPGGPHLSFLGDWKAIVDEARAFFEHARAFGWDEPEPERVLATVLFTDIVGSTETRCLTGRSRLGLTRRRASSAPCAHSSHGFAAARSIRRVTGSLRASTARLEPSCCAETIAEQVSDLGLAIRAGDPHRRMRARRWEGRGNRRQHRRTRGGRGRGRRGARVADRAATSSQDRASTSTIRGDHELKGIPGTWRLSSRSNRVRSGSRSSVVAGRPEGG